MGTNKKKMRQHGWLARQKPKTNTTKKTQKKLRSSKKINSPPPPSPGDKSILPHTPQTPTINILIFTLPTPTVEPIHVQNKWNRMVDLALCPPPSLCAHYARTGRQHSPFHHVSIINKILCRFTPNNEKI